MKRFYITLAGLFLLALAWEAGSQDRQRIYETRLWMGTNAATATDTAFHVYVHGKMLIQESSNGGPASLTLRGTSIAGGGALNIFSVIQPLNDTTNIAFTSHGEAMFSGAVGVGGTNTENISGFRVFGGHTSQFDANAVFLGNVGIGTNDPKALLHFYSPLTANPKLMQFDDDGHVPRAFAGIFPGGGGFSFFNGAGTNDNARTIGWTAASTIMNAPTTVEFQVGGVAQHRLTLTQFAPVSDNAERLGTSALRYSEGNFVNLTNAGSMSVGGRFGQTNKTLAYAGTTNVFVDGTLGNVFNLTLTANTHLIFTNIQEAYSGWINLVQDGTGSRLLSYNNANVKTNATITASTAAGSVDVLFFATGLIGTNLNIILHTAFK